MPDSSELPPGDPGPATSGASTGGPDAESEFSWPALVSPEHAATTWAAPDQLGAPPWPTATAPDRFEPETTRPPRRSRWLRVAVVVLSSVVAAALAGTAVALLQPDRPVRAAGQAGSQTPSNEPSGSGRTDNTDGSLVAKAALLDLLDSRAAAVLGRDKRAYLATIDPRAKEFLARQAKAFDSLAEVPLASWEYSVTVTDPFELSGRRREILGPSAWTVEVALRYELKGYDNAESRIRLYYTVVQRDSRWYLASDSDGAKAGHPSQIGLWDLGKVNSVEGRRSLILGLGSTGRLRRLADEADAAVPRVTKIWGSDWAGKALVVVPDSQAQMERLAGVDEGYYDQIAAVTRRETGRDADESAGDRVIINPELWAQLGRYGRRVVMTHEITHVATHDATSPDTPTWLSEGFADYVGYSGVPVPVDVAAQELLSAVRRDRMPEHLPTSREFAPGNERLAEAYEAAWLACRLLSERYGEDKLVEFYRAVGKSGLADDPEDHVNASLETVFGLTTKTFTAKWQAYLESLAG